MTKKPQTLQGYIIRILQHFATKLWNITNFVMADALSSCDEIFV
jgi:valyl-tRNA synthetase